METEQWHSEQRGFTLGWTLFLLWLWELQVDFHLSILNTRAGLVVDCNSLKHICWRQFHASLFFALKCISYSSNLASNSTVKFKWEVSPWGLLDVQMRITLWRKTSPRLLFLKDFCHLCKWIWGLGCICDLLVLRLFAWGIESKEKSPLAHDSPSPLITFNDDQRGGYSLMENGLNVPWHKKKTREIGTTTT